MAKVKICVIGLQGNVSEHIQAMEQAIKENNVQGEVVWARSISDLKNCNGIILPGGESTTIGKLLIQTQMSGEIKKMAKKGIPIMGTCAGAILVAKKGGFEVKKTKTKLLELIDIEIERNAYGRQIDSFEKEIEINGIGKFNGVFIRAPRIKKVFGKAKVFAMNGKEIAGAEQENIIAITFHPELAEDLRLHKLFLKKIKKQHLFYLASQKPTA